MIHDVIASLSERDKKFQANIRWTGSTQSKYNV